MVGVAGKRFRGVDPALQALDFVRQHASLSEEQKELLDDRFSDHNAGPPVVHPCRISLTGKDAIKFLTAGSRKLPQKTLIYLDPPYVEGRELYHDFYKPEDHAAVASFVVGGKLKQTWMVSYDNVKEIRTLYSAAQHVVYDIGYSARSARTGSEVMFFADSVRVPPDLGMVKPRNKQRELDL